MEHFSCPECGYENPKGSVSCKRCLLIFEKYEKKNMKVNSQVNGSKKLDEKWRELLTEYDNKDKHEAFIADALKEKNLQYASQQYRKMLDMNGADETAKRMIDKIIQIATLTYVPPFRKEPPKNTRWITLSILALIVIGVIAMTLMFMSRRP
ncbi:MAG: zinc ribbon domain-containing protein [Bdellovibrionota bacterium]